MNTFVVRHLSPRKLLFASLEYNLCAFLNLFVDSNDRWRRRRGFFQEEGTRSISSFLGTKLIWITRSRFITMVDASRRFEPTVDHLSLQLGASTRIAKKQDAYCSMKRCCFSPVLFFSSCIFEQ